MDWKVFTLDDDGLKLLGQEVANDLGRKIIESLREYPKSPNDLARELGQPLTTIIFHIEKLVSAGVVSPVGTMAGRRGRKTLYTLSSSAFLILPVRREEKESLLKQIRERIMPPRELIARSLIVGILVAIIVVGMPWYFMGASREYQPLKVGEAGERAGGINKGPQPAAPDHSILEKRSQESWMILLMLGVAASILAALITALWALRREVPPYSERGP